VYRNYEQGTVTATTTRSIVRASTTETDWRRLKHHVNQRFSNWGPRTKGGPRRVPRGVRERILKKWHCLHGFYMFNNSRLIYVFKFVTSIAWMCCPCQPFCSCLFADDVVLIRL